MNDAAGVIVRLPWLDYRTDDIKLRKDMIRGAGMNDHQSGGARRDSRVILRGHEMTLPEVKLAREIYNYYTR